MFKAISKGVIRNSCTLKPRIEVAYLFPFLKSDGLKISGSLTLEEEEGNGEKDKSEGESREGRLLPSARAVEEFLNH